MLKRQSVKQSLVHINYTLTRVTLFTPYFTMLKIWYTELHVMRGGDISYDILNTFI